MRESDAARFDDAPGPEGEALAAAPAAPHDLSARARTALSLALAFAAILVLYWIREAVFITFFGLLVGILVSHFADVGVRWLRLPRGLAVVFATTIIFAVVAVTVYLLTLPLIEQVGALFQELPRFVERVTVRIERFRSEHPGLARVLPPLDTRELAGNASQVAWTAVSAVRITLSGLVSAITIFFLALFFALEPDRYIRGVAELWPGRDAPQIWLMYRIGSALRSWMIATGIDMAVVAVLWTVGLRLADVDFWLLFGVIGGAAQIIPYYGPIITAIPPFLVALTVSGEASVLVLVIYLVIQLFDSYFLLPYLLDRQVNLPPVAVLVAIMALGSAFGFWGVILSMPVLTVLYVVVNQVYLRPDAHAAIVEEPPRVVPEERKNAAGETLPLPGFG